MTGLPDGSPHARDDHDVVDLPVGESLWRRVFVVAPLVLVGTRDGDGWDFAPKHMVMPLGWGPYFCFACSRRHGTLVNAEAHGHFTVSYPRPEQVVEAGLAAAPREGDGLKRSLAALRTFPARAVEGRLVAGCQLWLECELDRVVDGFDDASLVIGRVVAASAPREAVRDADVDDADLLHDLAPLAYLHPGRFAVLSHTLSFPYPAGFRL